MWQCHIFFLVSNSLASLGSSPGKPNLIDETAKTSDCVQNIPRNSLQANYRGKKARLMTGSCVALSSN